MLSLNNVELPSEISKNDHAIGFEVEEVTGATKPENGPSDVNNNTEEKFKSTDMDVNDPKKCLEQSQQVPYVKIIQKISSVITAIGKSWSKIVLADILPGNLDAQLFSSIESVSNMESMPHFVSKALEALTNHLWKSFQSNPFIMSWKF